MIQASIKFNKTLSEKLFKEYFEYERKKLFRQMPMAIMLLLSFGFLAIGYLSMVTFLMYMGVATSLIIVVAVLYYYWKFKKGFENFMRGLEEYAKENDGNNQLIIDDSRIVYKSDKYKNEISWDKIKSFETNNDVIYLYLEKNQLFDIYSPELMGEENFDSFLVIVKNKFDS